MALIFHFHSLLFVNLLLGKEHYPQNLHVVFFLINNVLLNLLRVWISSPKECCKNPNMAFFPARAGNTIIISLATVTEIWTQLDHNFPRKHTFHFETFNINMACEQVCYWNWYARVKLIFFLSWTDNRGIYMLQNCINQSKHLCIARKAFGMAWIHLFRSVNETEMWNENTQEVNRQHKWFDIT